MGVGVARLAIITFHSRYIYRTMNTMSTFTYFYITVRKVEPASQPISTSLTRPAPLKTRTPPPPPPASSHNTAHTQHYEENLTKMPLNYCWRLGAVTARGGSEERVLISVGGHHNHVSCCCVTTTQSWPPLASPVTSVVRSSSLSWYENDDGGGGGAYNICFFRVCSITYSPRITTKPWKREGQGK